MDNEISLTGPMALVAPMLPMILGMIDDNALDQMAEMVAAELTTHHGILSVETYYENETQDNLDSTHHTPKEFVLLILNTMFDSMKGVTNGG